MLKELIHSILAFTLLSLGINNSTEAFVYGVPILYPQDKTAARAEFSRPTKGKPKLIALYNLAEGYDRECSSFKYTGVIAGVKYDEDFPLRVLGITLRSRDGERHYFNVDQSLYTEIKLPRSDLEWVHTLLAKGRKVRLTAYGCGASGAVQYLHNVRAID